MTSSMLIIGASGHLRRLSKGKMAFIYLNQW